MKEATVAPAPWDDPYACVSLEGSRRAEPLGPPACVEREPRGENKRRGRGTLRRRDEAGGSCAQGERRRPGGGPARREGAGVLPGPQRPGSPVGRRSVRVFPPRGRRGRGAWAGQRRGWALGGPWLRGRRKSVGHFLRAGLEPAT